MLRKLNTLLLMQLALFVFISQSAFSAELITNPQLKEWIKSNTDQLPEVVINEDGGIDSTTANLEALAKIEQLDCSNFELTSIDELIVNMLNLKMLICRHTSLTELDVTKNTELIGLICSENQLSNLDVRNNIKLELLYCDINSLNNLDITSNINLIELACSENQLSNLDVSKNIELKELNCYNNQLKSLDVSKNIKLDSLACYGNQLSNLDISKNIELTLLYCNNNIFDNLDIRPLTNLVELKCCNQAAGFILYITKEQKSKFNEEHYCNAILKENKSVCEVEWLDIHPNPTAGNFFVDSKFLSDEIKILNLVGEVLYKSTLNSEKTEIDISNLPAGVYFVITKEKIGKVVKN